MSLCHLHQRGFGVGLFSQYFFHLLDSQKSNELFDPSCSFKIGYLFTENLLNF